MPRPKHFVVYEDTQDGQSVIGEINKQNYTELCDVILQLNYVNFSDKTHLTCQKSKIKKD